MSSPSPHTPENWSASADAYDKKIADFTGAYVGDLLGLANIAPSMTALEIAAGSGIATVSLAPRVAKVMATDYSQGMLSKLATRLETAGISNVEVSVQNGMDLTFESETFDVAISNFGLMLFDDRIAGFREMCRVLRPGATAVVSAWSTPERFEGWGVLTGAVRKAFPQMPAPESPPPIFSLSDPERFIAEMKEGGFSDVRIEPVVHMMEVDSPQAYWATVVDSAPPIAALRKAIGDQGIEKLGAQVQADLHERFGDASVSLSSEALIAVATK